MRQTEGKEGSNHMSDVLRHSRNKFSFDQCGFLPAASTSAPSAKRRADILHKPRVCRAGSQTWGCQGQLHKKATVMPVSVYNAAVLDALCSRYRQAWPEFIQCGLPCGPARARKLDGKGRFVSAISCRLVTPVTCTYLQEVVINHRAEVNNP